MEPSPCVVGVTSRDLVSEVTWLLEFQWVLWNCLLLAETLHISSLGKKPRLTLLSPLCLVWGSGALGLYYVGQSTQTPFPVLCIIRIPGRIRYLIKWIVTEQCLVLILPLTCCVLWGKSSIITSSEQGDQVMWVFLKGLPVMSIKVCKFMDNDVHFPPKCFSLKHLSIYISSPPVQKKFMCQIIIISLLQN